VVKIGTVTLRRIITLAFVAVAAAAATPTAALAATTAVTETATAPLSWGDCPPPTPGANGAVTPRDPRQQCATLAVPLDYANPRGAAITLAVSRIPGARHQALVVAPGGPGMSGLDEPSVWSGTAVGRQLLGAYDLIGFDDRGIGHSTPIHCGLSAADRDFGVAVPFPSPQGDISANVALAKRVADDCAANAGAYLPYVNTANVARDMDRIRAALGVPRLSYFGTSYGTYRGAVYTSLFPQRSDKIVLDSSVPPEGVLGALRLKGEGAATAFPDFAAWTAANDATFHLGTSANAVEAAYFRITTTLDAHPRTFPSGKVLTGNLVRIALPSMMEKRATFPVMAAILAVGDGQDLPVSGFGQPIPDNFESDQFAVICGDAPASRNPATYAAAVQIERRIHPLTNGMPANIWACAFWPRDAVHSPVPITADGPRDVLMLQNRRDPSTAYSGALRMRAALGSRAELTTVDDVGHGVDLTNPCTATRLTDFLLRDRLPASDAACGATS
jgi:pimeloyl-ACP methyl ester carboxylesterase